LAKIIQEIQPLKNLHIETTTYLRNNELNILIFFSAKDPINVPFESLFFNDQTFPKKFLDFKIKSLNISSEPSKKLIDNDGRRFFFDFLYRQNLDEFEQNYIIDYKHIYEEH